jgi:hypothetical protein
MDLSTHFQEKLPQEMREKFGIDLSRIPRQYRQHPDITSSLIEAAAGTNPDGSTMNTVRPASQARLSMAEQAALVQSMLAAERQMQEAQRPLSE